MTVSAAISTPGDRQALSMRQSGRRMERSSGKPSLLSRGAAGFAVPPSTLKRMRLALPKRRRFRTRLGGGGVYHVYDTKLRKGDVLMSS